MAELVSQMFQRMSAIRPKRLEWAWDGLVPMGKLTLLTGDPGVGKSLVALQVASMVSRGVKTPLGLTGPGGVSIPADKKRELSRGVLIFSGADQPEDTLLPRLVAAGADASQIFFFKGYMVNEVPVEKMLDENASGLRPFRLSRDLGEVQWCLEELADEGIDVGLIVIDSIDRYIGADEKKNARIEAVAELADLAARNEVAVLVTTNSSMKAGSRGGTVVYHELINAARSVLMVVQDLEDPERRLVLSAKHNLTARPLGVSFAVERGAIRWGAEPVHLSAEEYLVRARLKDKRQLIGEDVRELDRVTNWLEDELKDGQVSSDSIQRRAIEVDISYGTLRRASKLLECKVRKQNNQWFWSLPDHSEARCANVTDSKNGVLVCESAGNRQEEGLDLLGQDSSGEMAELKEKALVS